MIVFLVLHFLHLQIACNDYFVARKGKEEKNTTQREDMRHREVLAFLRLTLQYSSIGIRRLTATSRMWLRRKRILPAGDESTCGTVRGQ